MKISLMMKFGPYYLPTRYVGLKPLIKNDHLGGHRLNNLGVYLHMKNLYPLLNI